MKEFVRILLIVCGTLSLALGVLGIFLPLLPTTPFLLLAAACYARSSKRFYHWLMNTPWCGEYIHNYRQGRGIPLKQKVLTILLLWLTIGYTVTFAVPRWWAKLLLLGIAGGVTIHLIRIRTFNPEAQPPSAADNHGPARATRHGADAGLPCNEGTKLGKEMTKSDAATKPCTE